MFKINKDLIDDNLRTVYRDIKNPETKESYNIPKPLFQKSVNVPSIKKARNSATR